MTGKELLAAIRDLFEYRGGAFYWKTGRSRTKAGSRAGDVAVCGYRRIRIDRFYYYEHRMVFLLHHGFLPKYIDHIDGVKTNNDISNLREATPSQNNSNSKTPRHNTSGVKGVCWHRESGKWLGYVGLAGKRFYLGLHETRGDAESVVREARSRIHGEFARHE